MRVELTAVRKRYGATLALDGIDLDLASGSRLALIGPNGSGKTTLIRVIMGLIAHDGELRLDGQPARAARAAVADQIAYVPQVAPQMAASVGDVVASVGALRGARRDAIAAIAGELGLDVRAVADRPFRSLSGGMKQKLLIALAMAARPRLIILDEPTASLDAASRARFVELQRDLLGDATVVLCSHRLDELRALVDRVVALEDGRIRHDGSAADFVRRHTSSVIELLVDDDRDATWLHARGFSPMATGWWARPVDHGEKMRLIPDAVAALGDRLRDLVVRDLDRLVPTAEVMP
jgi:ABC-2 type transport system ATP-binding protein